MHVSDLQAHLPLTHVAGPDACSFDGVYAGDLLSRAMSHIQPENLWITIMNNVNVIAVASLTEASAVLIAEDVTMTEEAKNAADEKGVPVYASSESVYTLCCRIFRLQDAL